jgi:type IV pilus assembly protein PilW
MNRRQSSSANWTTRGRTLVELLIAITIGIVVLGALTVVYLSTSLSGRQSTAVARMNEDAATALSFIGPQLRMAGFSLPRRGTLPVAALVDGVKTSPPDRNFAGAGVRACDHGFTNATTATFADLSCSSASTGPAAFALRFEGADPTGTDSLRALLPLNSDCLGNEVDSTKYTTGALGVAYPLVESRFWAAVNSSSGTSDLSCAGNGKNFSPQPLVQYVEDIRLRFGVAKDGQSFDVVQYLETAAGVDALGGSVDQNWSRVVTVRLCLLMRSADSAPAGAGSKYVDCDGGTVTPSDNVIRRAYVQTIALRNRSGFVGSAS